MKETEFYLYPCISFDTRIQAITFILAAVNGDVHHAEPVNSPLGIKPIYAATRRAMPALPSWDEIGDRLIRQYCLLAQDQQKRKEGAIAA